MHRRSRASLIALLLACTPPAGLLAAPVAIALAAVSSPALGVTEGEAVEIEGARFATRLEVQGRPYLMIGSGLFRYLIWDAYAGAYYQAQGFPRPAPLSEVPRRLELEYFHAIAAEKFAEATRDTLRDTLDGEAFRRLAPGLADFNRRYRDVAPGDRYALSWDGTTLRLALNGETLYRGEDPALAKALFGIWLGEAPLGTDFRDALLGR